MAAVAPALVVAERAWHVEGKAVSLPGCEPAGERPYVRVAELCERFCGESGAAAAGAVDDQRACAIRGRGLDARLQVPTGDVDCARDVPFLPFVPLPDVDDDRGLRLEKSARGRRV